MQEEHPFAPTIRILGKGKNGSRSLTIDEAYDAMTMILEDKVTAEQLGAFLMLLRVKEETPEEVAGFVRAIRDFLNRIKPVLLILTGHLMRVNAVILPGMCSAH